MEPSDFKAFFEQSSELMIVIDTAFNIVAASNAYLNNTATTRENITGQNFFSVFPDNPADITTNGVSSIFSSLQRVIHNKTTDSTDVIKYDIPKPASQGGGFIVKYWSLNHSPVFNELMEVKYIVQQVVDVTQREALAAELAIKTNALKHLEESEKRYNMMLMKSQFAFAVLKGKDKIIVLANDRVKKIWGKGMDIEGKSLLEIMPELQDTPFPALLDEVLTTGITYHGKEVQSPKDVLGQLKDEYFNFVFQPYLEADETISGITIMGQEVTPQVMISKKLQESEDRFHSLADCIPLIAFTIEPNAEATISFWNKTWLDYTGQTPEAAMACGWYGIIHPDDMPGMLESYTDAFEKRAPYFLPAIRMKRFDGEYRWHMVKSNPRYLPGGAFMGYIGVGFDIHESKLSVDALQQSEERFRLLVTQAPVAIMILKGADYKVEIANNFYLALVDQPPGFIGKPIFDSLPELKTQGIRELLDSVMQTGIPFHGNELEVNMQRDQKKHQGFYNFVYQPIIETNGLITGITVVATEVTGLVVARKKMEVQTQLFEDMLMTSPGFVATLRGPDHVYELVNKQYQGLFGKRAIKGMPILVALPELQGQGFDRLLDKVYNTGEPYVGIDIPIMLARDENLSPELRYFNFSYQPMYDEHKAIYSILVFGYEVTEEMIAKKRIEESELHFRQMADLMPAKITNASPAGAVTYYNKNWLDYTGMSFIELENFGYQNIIHPEDLEEFKDRFKTATDTGTVLNMEMRVLNKEGEYKWHLNLASPVKEENGNIKMWVGSTTDIHEQKTASEKIKESEERFRLLVLQAPVAICILRGERYIIETVNRQMLYMWGRNMADVINKCTFDVLPEFKNQGVKELLDTVYTTGESIVVQELPLKIARNGQIEDVFVKFVYEPLRNAAGTITGVMALAHEITDQVVARKKIEESEIKFRLLTNAMPQKISTAGADGSMTFFNQRWMNITGLTFEELKGEGWLKAVHPDDAELCRTNWKQSVGSGDVFEMEYRIQNKEGKYKWYLSRAVPVKNADGKTVMWVGSNTDIQQIKQEEERKGNFIKMVSHELKTPVTAIKGYIQLSLMMLEDENTNRDTGKLKTSLVRIDRQIERLTRLISEMLDLSRIEEHKLTLQKSIFSLNELVAETVADFYFTDLKQSIILYDDDKCSVNCDRDKIAQVLINFISNAVKYSPADGIIEIRIFQTKDNHVSVSVKDNGIGIDVDEHQNIFERFYRVGGVSEQTYPGFGIGLFIANSIMESHQGFITVESKKGKGATFTFTLNGCNNL